jgi:hypothetical protein
MDRSLNEDPDYKIRKYRADYNNNPPTTVSFMTVIASTSGRLHSEFVSASSGAQLVQHDRDQFHFRRAAFSQ